MGRDLFGVFPLRGKLLNARDATFEQLRDNVELNHVMSILGLSYDKKYDNEEVCDFIQSQTFFFSPT